MFATICLAPLLMMGYALPISTSWHHSDLTPSAIISAQTCTTGAGAYARGTLTGAYMAGIQYGFGAEHRGFEFSAKPQIGLSYVDHAVKTLPAREQYHLGGEINICYDRFCSGLSYSHLSNGDAIGLCWSGGKCHGNVGEDMVAVTMGVRL